MVVVQSLSCICFFAIAWTALCDTMDFSTQGSPVLHHLPELAQTHVHQVDDTIQPSHPLSSTSPAAFNLSQRQGFFQWVSSCIRWLKYWSFSFSISPFSEYSGSISFRIDWFEHHSSKVSILQCSAFFMVQLSHAHCWKNHSFDYMNLCRQSNVSAF